MRGFTGANGRVYSDAQRKAMFAGVKGGSLSGMFIKIADPDVRHVRNRFVIPVMGVGASLLATGAAAPMGAVGGAGASLAGAGFAGAAPGIVGAGVSVPVVSNIPGLGSSKSNKSSKPDTLKPYKEGALDIASKGPLAAATVVGGIFSDSDDVIPPSISKRNTGTEVYYNEMDNSHRGIPPVALTAPEMVYAAYMSKRPDAYSIDVDKMRDVLKKQYPGADVDSDVTMLPPDKYMKVALEENPGREQEAMMSNGFYSPTTDKTYLEAGDRLNTTRAMLHEYVHDMSNEGVEDYMLNEGYADYVAKELMEQELNIPAGAVRKTLGYPRDVERVEGLVDKFGRKNVDKAFLTYHTLDYLDKLDKGKGSYRNT